MNSLSDADAVVRPRCASDDGIGNRTAGASRSPSAPQKGFSTTLPPSWARPSAPLFVHLLITRICNWDCPFCVIKATSGNHGDVNRIESVVARLGSAKVFDVTLFGGEPLLHPHAVRIGRMITDHGMQAGFVSNGDVRLDPREVAKGFPQGAVSIHGLPHVHDAIVQNRGAFDRSARFLREYVSAGGRASLCVTVGRKNLDTFQSFCDYVSVNLPVVSVVVNPVIPFPGGADALDREDLEMLGTTLTAIADRLSCSGIYLTLGATVPFCALPSTAAHLASACYAGTLFATVDSNGDVCVCPERDSGIGNILQTDLTSLWGDCSEFEEQSSGSFANEGCLSCVAYTWCIGGCRSTRGGATSTTDIRFRGPEVAQRNLDYLSERLGNRPEVQKTRSNLVSIASGVRSREEPFGMFVLTPEGQPLALDKAGSRLFAQLLKEGRAQAERLAQESDMSVADVSDFFSQGIRLGVLTEPEGR